MPRHPRAGDDLLLEQAGQLEVEGDRRGSIDRSVGTESVGLGHRGNDAITYEQADGSTHTVVRMTGARNDVDLPHCLVVELHGDRRARRIRRGEHEIAAGSPPGNTPIAASPGPVG